MKEIEEYFYNETADFKISDIQSLGTKDSYFDNIECFLIKTEQEIDFFVFRGNVTAMNLYPKGHDSLDECYYKHIGFVAELTSRTIHKSFILDFIKQYSIFPIIDRKLNQIVKNIQLGKNVDDLNAIANQIRTCYLNLTDYLINKNISHNPDFKQDSFIDNVTEFINYLLPGKTSERRRKMIKAIAENGWIFNSNLIHKESITVFDIMTSVNILNLIISIINNVIVGNDMPFNKIKCPNCESEKFKMKKINDKDSLQYICKDCGTSYDVSIDTIVKDFK